MSPGAASNGGTTRVLVTGAVSGLGRAFLEHYAACPDHAVVGIDARPWPEPGALPTCAQFVQLDITDEAAIKAFLNSSSSSSSSSSDNSRNPTSSNQSSDRAPSPAPPHFQLVIHSAGIRGLVPAVEAAHPDDVSAAETIAVMDAATMLRTYETNTVDTFVLLKHLLPMLLQLAQLGGRPPKVVVMSSRMGSISYNTAGGAYAYRASKSALNQIVKSFSVDVPEVLFASVHPGRVETGLVKTREEGAIEVEESVGTMVMDVIERLGRDQDGLKSGCFVDRWGNEIGW